MPNKLVIKFVKLDHNKFFGEDEPTEYGRCFDQATSERMTDRINKAISMMSESNDYLYDAMKSGDDMVLELFDSISNGYAGEIVSNMFQLLGYNRIKNILNYRKTNSIDTIINYYQKKANTSKIIILLHQGPFLEDVAHSRVHYDIIAKMLKAFNNNYHNMGKSLKSQTMYTILMSYSRPIFYKAVITDEHLDKSDDPIVITAEYYAPDGDKSDYMNNVDNIRKVFSCFESLRDNVY